MGNKIITEKDFWMCSTGAMPAQLQGTRKSNKKKSGEVYITVADTATSSWIDFGCTKHMLFAALLAAVVAVVVVAAIVATGGMAAVGILGMMAIGAGAGVVGGIIAAVDGALKCGQKNATQRKWDDSKKDLLFTGTPAITGNRTMNCAIGGVVKFAPEIKSWTHAILLGGFNYATQLAGCALGGAAVGAGGYLITGAAGGTLTLSAPTLGSVLSNVAGSFTGVWGASRAFFGLNNVANEQAYGNINNPGDAASALIDGGVPEIGMAKRIFTGQAQPSDYMLFLYLLHVKAKGPNAPTEEPAPKNDGEQPSGKSEENGQPKEDESVKSSNGEGESTAKPKEGKEANAFEEGRAPEFETVELSDGTKVKRLKPNSDYNANGYEYKTDAAGRIKEVDGTLKLEKGGRNEYAQRTVGKNDGRLPDDQGGHLIGDQFGGAGGKENLVPMDKGVNNYHKGEWGQMEKNWAKELKDGKEVKVKIEPQYTGESSRPSSFKITETIDGVTEKFTIFN